MRPARAAFFWMGDAALNTGDALELVGEFPFGEVELCAVPEAPAKVETWGVPEAIAMAEVCSAVVLGEEELSPAVAVVVSGLPVSDPEVFEVDADAEEELCPVADVVVAEVSVFEVEASPVVV